jgi:superfamily II DNA/RNA helicase
MHFTSFNFHSQITAAIQACGYPSPTPIQRQAIPPALEGRDILGLAQTGTGKTAAFVLPILQRLLDGPRKRVRALIIAPTRELAEQIHGYIGKMAGKTDLRSVVVYGGVGKQGQIKKIRKGVEIVVACPGRLLDHLGDRAINLEKVELLVLDEADHMFDKGFLPEIRRILKYLPKQRQTLIFSATMPKEIRHLAKNILNDPATVQINHTLPAATISHRLFPVEQQRKTALLKSIMEQTEMTATLVFTRTKHRAKKLAQQLQNAGYKATSLQGNLSQQKRQQALDGFRHGKFKILVATDVASRGIDVSGISHVINYDMPDTAETYTHRTGRTGRAARTGKAFTFAVRDDSRMIRIIERSLGKKMARQTLSGFNDHASSGKDEIIERGKPKAGRPAPPAPARTNRRKRRSVPFDFDVRNLSRRSGTRGKRTSSLSST